MQSLFKFPIKVYADTSVIGGVFDVEFKRDSVKFFDLVKRNYFKLVISPVVIDEIKPAGSDINAFFNTILSYAEIVSIDNEALDLRQAYINEGILTIESSADALHVALASVNRIPLIVSWNFKHIVNFKKIAFYNAVNLTRGYPSIGIYSPKEVIEYEQ